MFSYCGRDSLLIATLAYNVGYGTVMGNGKRPKSRLLQKIECGDRNIYNDYITFCRWKGRLIRAIHIRRKVELELLYQP